MTALETRLRRALANTNDQPPRPITDLDLPLKMEKLITPRMLRSLRPAAVLAPVIRRGSALSMLFTVRSSNLRSHKGQISFPGGRRDEQDATTAATALREAQEEIGLDPASVEIVGYLDDYPTVTRYLVTPVVGIVHGEPRLKLHEGEVAEVFETPLGFVLDESRFERKAFSRAGLNVPFLELNWQHYRIWGATAGMLWNLCSKVARA